MTNESDETIAGRVQGGNAESFGELVERYQDKLLRYGRKFLRDDDAEDIVQDVFIKAYENIQSFDTTRRFSPWIYRIAHNEAVNYLKRKSKRYTISWDDIATSKDKLDTATDEQPPEEKWLQQEIKEEITEAIKKLPKRYRQVLMLRYFQEYSYEEISKTLERPINTIGTLINRAKKKLFEVVKEQRIEE